MDIEALLAALDDEAVDSPFLSTFIAQNGLGHDLRGELTGRDRLFHGTTTGNAASILSEGLQPSPKTGISHMLDEEFRPPAAYMTHHKRAATAYGNQAANLEDWLRNAPPGDEQGSLKRFAANRGARELPNRAAQTLEARVPSWQLGTIQNPEVKGGLGAFRERSAKAIEEAIARGDVPGNPKVARFAGKNIGAPLAYSMLKGDKVFPGGVPAEFFLDSSKYKPQTLAELASYLKAKPLRALGGLGRGALGLYAGTAAARGLYESLFGEGE